MENNYIITVVGKQTVDGESDKIEVITEGDIRETGDKLVITYPEYPEDDPQKKTDTTVTLDGGILSIERKGEMSSHSSASSPTASTPISARTAARSPRRISSISTAWSSATTSFIFL